MGSHLNHRDVKAVRKTVSGFIKLLHPDGEFSKEELKEYLEFAMEGRRRIKEQLRRMGGLEYWAVNFSYIDLETRQETFIAVPEQGGGGMIPPGILDPGVTYNVSRRTSNDRLGVFRVESQAVKGNGKLRITGSPRSEAREAIKTAHTYLKTNANKLGLTKSPHEYDLHAQLVSLTGEDGGSSVGIAFFVAMVSALLGKPTQESLVVLGEMSLRGGLKKMDLLTERLQLAMDNGAKRVLLPIENKRDLVDVPGDVLDKLQIIFYSEPINAAFRAMELD
jgi:ATP-dependent Lon protease